MITVAIPTYNNAKIIWLQLSSLCAQIDAPEWELIMCEEESENTFGSKQLADWKAKLTAANCVKITYLELDQWVALGQKWITIREYMHPESVGMLLCASDDYSSLTRIKDSYTAMIESYDWTQWKSGYFYNIKEDKAALFTTGENRSALEQCISKACLDNMNVTMYPRKGVDTWLFTGTKLKNIKHNGMTDGIHTDGYNTISLNRRKLYNNTGLFTKEDENKVFGLFPKHIQKRLKTMRK